MPTLNAELTEIAARGLQRQLLVPSGIDFSSNDFFGLSRSDRIRQTLIQFLEREGALGTTGSRLVSGHSTLIQVTEEYLARIFGQPAALFFGSGYLANLGATYTLSSPDCEFFSDEFNHASLIDGMRLCKSKISIFRHNDLEHLRGLLRNSTAHRKVIVSESVFSMVGDGPDLDSLRLLMDEFEAYLIFDEAHATGICGKKGLGHAHDIPFNSERTIVVHTCGKALGGYGAFVLTSKVIYDLMINKARSFIYSTALSPIHVVQTKMALSLLTDPSYRQHLEGNIELLKQNLQAVGILCPVRHILSIPIPGNDKVTKAAEFLQKKHFFVRAIRSPTVPPGQESLRMTVKSFHDPIIYQELAPLLAQVLA